MFQVAAQGCLVIFLQLWLHGSTQDCLRPANTDDDSLPSFKDLENAEQLPNGNGAQAIVTNYQFHCCGNITAWQTQVEPNGEDLTYSINFQVWRPSPTVGSDGAGKYSLVGENRFTSITSVSPISVTPEPTNAISVRPKDVVGFFQSHPRNESTDGIQLVTSSYSYDRLLWYQTSFSLGSASTVMVGTGGTLPSSTNAGMQLSVEIASYSCTPLPTPQTTPPTTAPLTTTPPTTEAIPHVDPTTDTPTRDTPLVNQPTTPESATDQTLEPPTTPQEATGPISQTIPPSLSDDNSVNIGLIVSLVVVVVLLLMASAIIASIAIRRYCKTESKKFNNQINRCNEKGTRQTLRQATLMKPMSSSNNSPDILSDGVTNAGYSTHCFQDSCTEESQHYYSAVDASTGAFTDSEVTSQNTVTNSAGYDVCFGQESLESKGQCGVYEEPTKIGFKEPDSCEYENIYMVPGSDEATLYAQLAHIKADMLSRRSLRLGNLLGSGQFGMVYKGAWQTSTSGSVEVAVKTLKKESSQEDKIKFLQEAAIMGQFKHPNVVEMYGVITDKEPILLVLEMLKKGDLRAYLLKMRNGGVNVDGHTFLTYCRQVVSGMVYLSNKAFVHRDLAARNVLVSDDDICKIADFGMSRDLMNESYYISHGGKIPVKWTAPEALHYKKYSTASDVWSYGALMYEIWSVGHKPFEELTNNQVIKKVDTGYRLPPPPGCPRAIYNIMIQCWHPVTSKRPGFKDISSKMTSCSEDELLKLPDEDRQTHPDADKLGADLDVSQNLYFDLQTLYVQKSECQR